jgi:ABC-type lipoprotein export system ATPase subunit
VTESKIDYTAQGEAITRMYRVDHSEVHALRGANFWCRPGEFVALMGRSGSGKTTLLNIIGGLDHPTTGRIAVFGKDISEFSDHEATDLRRRSIGFVFQSFALMPTMSAFENVELPLRMVDLGRRERVQRVNECLEVVKLTRWAKHRPQELSGGQQQRVAIARALVNRPKLILADEPTGELDSVTGRGIMTLFRAIATEEHVTVIMATHDPTVEEYVDYTYRMADGRVLNER